MDNATKKIENMEKQIDEWLEKRELIASEVLITLQRYDIDTGEADSILNHVSMALRTHADIKSVKLNGLEIHPYKEGCPF